MAGLQFIGRKDVINAVKSKGLTTWGLFQSRQFITAGDGVDALDQFLERLEAGGAGPTYTLKVYKDESADDVTDKTECNGSFNFKLNGAGAGSNEDVNARLGRIEAMLAGDEDDDEDDEDDENSLSGIILGYLKDPVKLVTVINGLRGQYTQPAAPDLVPGSIGTVDDRRESQAFAANDIDARTQRLAIVLDRLERQDPKILEHLEKLAALAETKPELFKLLLTQLDHGL